MSEIKVNKISPKQTCTQLTLGDSGDTIIIPAGATITNNGTATGFGRTGTVDWDTTKKTSGFTAVSGVGYFCDTTSAAFTVTLPSSPSAGAIVAVSDYANTFATNNLTVGRNGSNIGGSATNAVLATNGIAVTLVYVDSTQGWVVTDSGNRSDVPVPTFIVATGGTITTSGDFKIHTFTGPGTFTVSSIGNPAGGPNSVDYLVVAGGASGATGTYWGGGGGAGGYRTSFPGGSSLPVTATGYPITVGGGGAATGNGSSGSPSIFSTITSTGGGPGGTTCGTGGAGVSGGSGGGAGGGGPTAIYAAGTGNSPPVSPSQGNPGGQNAGTGYTRGTGGGGGAGATGTSGTPSGSGPGGNGSANSISGSSVTYAGGGGGGSNAKTEPGGANLPAGDGGTGGGGCGAARGPGYSPVSRVSTAGGTNTGGGGGGSGGDSNQGAAGGSGIVVIRYKFQ